MEENAICKNEEVREPDDDLRYFAETCELAYELCRINHRIQILVHINAICAIVILFSAILMLAR